jgi:hypothetical protein
MREFVEMICPTGEAKYFCKGDSTEKCPTGKSLQPLGVHVDKLSPAEPITSSNAIDGYRFRLPAFALRATADKSLHPTRCDLTY